MVTNDPYTSARDDTKAAEDSVLSVIGPISFSLSQIIRNHSSKKIKGKQDLM